MTENDIKVLGVGWLALGTGSWSVDRTVQLVRDQLRGEFDLSRVFEDEELGNFSHELGQPDIKVVEEREQVHHPDVTHAALVERECWLGQAHGLCSAPLRDIPQETNLPETRPDRPRQRTLRWLALRHVVDPSLSMASGTTPRKPRRTCRDFYDDLQPHATGQIVNFLGGRASLP